ncbi:dethiobiotin synthase [Haloferax elongans ATCC BAA-1513]|uniref:ATP-dependent dethiobiotin synthetase BioD n=1 Tax=Haloferax elongans ATCC BAA-1513 TaxID=1230453 RepID=M0I0P7_HALEO|nr:dethiobiotin synthase [Haloferax elongans]ELZ89578.1 dethiobiotin synthase [Haloferax elongans ATCC BAA-1513]
MTESETLDDAFAVVGTDTNVGKTFVTAGLVGWLRELGSDARGVKPVQSGYPPDDDAAFVADVCGDDSAATCPRRLGPALAPAVAADVADETLEYETIRDEARSLLAESNLGVLEGVGGLRVPLADGREVIDLVADLGIPAVLVARSGLGTLNHTALSVSALRNRGITVSAIVLNHYEGETLAERTNPDVLVEMTDCPVHTLPPLDVSEPSAVVTGVREHLPPDVFPERVVSGGASLTDD